MTERMNVAIVFVVRVRLTFTKEHRTLGPLRIRIRFENAKDKYIV